ncbi:serine/threonine-protein kinase SBK1-like [Conger conger]|uniref:serine/threonine-protein kinase SBK1-like n=1 Tax=Conger conger TaxID=82655 RepID=UPI002A59A9FF|nr:serine/threonine-protein kinase SBK1-like [Conger conger]
MTASAKQLDALCHLTAQALPSLQTKNHFKIIKLLGEGSYGKVMLAVHKKRGTPMALKFFPRGSTSLISFLREYNLSLAFCSHPSLTRALGIVYSTPLHYVFAQQAGLYGDLYDIIDPEVGMAEEMVQRVASQVSGALSHLHALGFVHRDVKPENIFLCDQTCQWVKLGDFGMVKPKGARVPAVWYDSPYCVPEVEMARGRKEQKASNGKNSKGKGAKGIGAVIPGTSTKAGSKEEKKKTIWVSVEVGIDSWALGILVYSLLTGCYPWKETSSDDPGYRKYKDWLDRERKQEEKGEEVKWKGQDLGRSGWSNEAGGPECGPAPPQFEVFTPLAWSLFQGLLSPQPCLRTMPEDVLRYLGSAWLLTKGEVEKTLGDKGKEKEKEKGGRT